MKFNADDFKAFFNELAEDGFHIFSREHAQQPAFSPHAFPSYPEIDIADTKEGDKITIRAFFTMNKPPRPPIDSGSIDLEVESVDHDSKKVFANILTELPATFSLSQGTTIELTVGEVLFIQDRQTIA